MSEKKKFLLRIPPDLWDDIQRLADKDLRSANAQIEYLLRQAVRQQIKRGKESEKDESD